MMKLENYFNFQNVPGISGLFFTTGDFGTVDGDVDYEYAEENGTQSYSYTDGKIRLCAKFTEYPNGLVLRSDTFENLTDKPLVVNRLVSRFCVGGNKYEAYTQFNGWQHESSGGWQKLVTEVSVASRGIRTCDGATPMLALYNEYNAKSTVFHLFPNCQWRMTVKKMPIWSKYETTVIETGFESDGLKMQVNAGETIELPRVAFFQAESKIDLDAYKLHEVYNTLYPRKRTPVLYNSWLYCFDNLDIEALLCQVDAAAELGIETFMIDAGWFGEGDGWGERVGDWTENMTGGPKGRLIEIANRVREKGMTFGLWFEPERAGTLSKVINEHPDYYINGRFFDFTNAEARAYMISMISAAIDKYGIGWIKFDFNDTIPYDKTGSSFYRYLQGQKTFVESIKVKYPALYITNCASGGYRMEMEQGTFTDSFWLSDNQGPYEGLKIVTNTIKRMPSALIERWCVQKYCEGFLEYGNKEKVGRMLYCNNGTWDHVINVRDNYEKAFMTGGPIGFSSDLAALPERYKAFWKESIAEFKQDREIYANGTARVLVDDQNLVVLAYTNAEKTKTIVQIFTKDVHTAEITVYPEVEETATYTVDGKTVGGRELKVNGLTVNGLLDNDCKIIRIVKE